MYSEVLCPHLIATMDYFGIYYCAVIDIIVFNVLLLGTGLKGQRGACRRELCAW